MGLEPEMTKLFLIAAYIISSIFISYTIVKLLYVLEKGKREHKKAINEFQKVKFSFLSTLSFIQNRLNKPDNGLNRAIRHMKEIKQ